MKTKRRNTPYTGCDIEEGVIPWNYSKMWSAGWFDDYDQNHFLIRALMGDDRLYYRVKRYCNEVTYNGEFKISFAETFCNNLLFKLNKMIDLFGVEKVREFVSNQLAAGKKHYSESKFFQALTEIEVICFFGTFGPGNPKGEYEPRSGRGNCNPEASLIYPSGNIINIEVKTPEFQQSITNGDIFMPLYLLSEKGLELFEKECKKFGCIFKKPRMTKLKTFLESACEKFHEPKEGEYNILCINWSYTDVIYEGYIEPAMMLCNIKKWRKR